MQLQLGAIIDVAITLCGLFIALGTICSFLTEQAATLCQLRGNKLYSGVLNLVFSRKLADAIFAHAMLDTSVNDKRGLRNVFKLPNRPSYIDPKTFAMAFWDEVANLVEVTAPPTVRAASAVASAATSGSTDRMQAAKTLVALRAASTDATGTGPMPSDAHFEDLRAVVDALPIGSLKTNALNLLSQSAPTYTALTETTGAWFETQMNRVSGWYTRQAQYIVIVFAVLVVVITGLDSLEIAQRLYAAPALLSAAESRIAGAFATPPPTDADRVAAARAAMNLIRGETFGGFLHPAFGLHLAWPKAPAQGDENRKQSTVETIDDANLKIAQAAYADAEWKLDDARTTVRADASRFSEASIANEKAKANYDRAASADKSALKPNVDASEDALKTAESALQNDVKKAQDSIAGAKVADDDLKAAQAEDASHGSHVLGWLCTFFAAALGAPFWFNLLGKFINVRGAGTKPA